MTPVTHAKGKQFALFGLGGSGLATALALQAGGARVLACDDSETQMAKAAAQGVETADLRNVDWRATSALILSPGVPLTHKDGRAFTHWSVELARANGVEIIGDIELFCRERRVRAPDAPLIAITGTNGKSTTTALIAHILRVAGLDAQMGGNIGAAVLSLSPPAANRFHVIECSSFQIDLSPSLDPDIGVLLNVTPDHLDRHGDLQHYAAIKERLVARAKRVVIGCDDDPSRAMAQRLPQEKVTRISAERSADIFFRDNRIWRSDASPPAEIADLSGVASLRGAHNGQNAAAAVAAARALGLSDSTIAQALRAFPGLPHRLEEIGRIGSSLFVNDSKATNADSTEKALASFSADIFWILGGKSKEGGITPLRDYFPRVAKAYLIGAASDEFAATLGAAVPHEPCGALDIAVQRAARDAQASTGREPVVLLSPACASYDQYPNFEARGDHFRALVKALPGFAPAHI